MYWYAWRGGPRLPDPADGLEAFARAHREALEAHAAPVAPSAPAPTLATLAAAYRDSPDFAQLAPRTQALYLSEIARMERDGLASMPVKALASLKARGAFVAWRDRRAATPRGADTGIEVAGALLSWAVLRGLAPANPAHGIPALHRVDRSDDIVTPWELAFLCAASSPRAAEAWALAAETGLRRGDLVALQWREVDAAAGIIERRTLKTGSRAEIPLTPAARSILDRAPRVAETVLSDDRGRPWGLNVLSHAWQDARARTGIRRRLHDLRGTAATRLAAAGLSALEIGTVLGWDEQHVSRILRRYVSRGALARDIARRLAGG